MKTIADNFKIRCSQISEIMTPPKSKNDIISKTTLEYLKTYALEKIYNRKKIIHSKELTKGNICEQNGIDRYNYTFGTNYKKYIGKQLENDYFIGTPDILHDNIIIDIKNSFEFYTFPLLEMELSMKYYYQIQGYMYLTGIKKGEIVYVLEDMPDELLKYIDPDLHENYKYFDVPDNLRIKVFKIDYNPQIIDKIIETVLNCRIVLNELLKQFYV